MWGMRSIDDQMMITELRAGLLCLSERLHLHRLDPSISRSIEVGTASPCIQSQGGGGRKPNQTEVARTRELSSLAMQEASTIIHTLCEGQVAAARGLDRDEQAAGSTAAWPGV